MSANAAPSSAATVSLVSALADAVIAVRAQILPVTRFPVCVAAVLNAIDAAVYFSIVSECRCWNRLGRHGSKDTVERRIEPAFHRDIGYKNTRIFADAELVLTLCSRPRDCWSFFVLA